MVPYVVKKRGLQKQAVCNPFLNFLFLLSAKSKQFAIEFARFWEVEIMIFSDFWRSELRFSVTLEVRRLRLRIFLIF